MIDLDATPVGTKLLYPRIQEDYPESAQLVVVTFKGKHHHVHKPSNTDVWMAEVKWPSNGPRYTIHPEDLFPLDQEPAAWKRLAETCKIMEESAREQWENWVRHRNAWADGAAVPVGDDAGGRGGPRVVGG